MEQSAWRRRMAIYMLSQGISLLGSSIVSFAIRWYVTLHTASSMAVAGVTVTTYLPQALVMLWGGVIADRRNPQRVVMLSDSFIALSTLLLALMFLSGNDSLLWLYFFNVLRSIGAGIELPSVKSTLPMIVPAGQLEKANSLFTGIWCACQLVSPGLSGLAMSALPMPAIFMIDVVTAIIGVGAFACITVEKKAQSESAAPPLRQIGEGLRYIRGNRCVVRALAVFGLISFLTAPADQLSSLLAARNISGEVWVLSAAEMAFSVGALGMSGYMSLRKLPLAHGAQTRLAALLFGVSMALLAFQQSALTFSLLMLLMGIGSPLYYTPITTAIQLHTDEAHMGRVFSCVDLTVTLATPLGMIFSGVLAGWKLQAPFLLCGGALAALAALWRTEGMRPAAREEPPERT